MQVGERLSDQLLERHRDLRKLKEGGALSRLGDREGSLLGLVLRHM